MDALNVLRDDHERVRKLMAQLSRTTPRSAPRRQELFAELSRELALHEEIEEKVLYPALVGHRRGRALIVRAREDHRLIDTLKSEIADTPPDDERWIARVGVLRDQVEGHVWTEEREIFPLARRELAPDERADLAERIDEVRRRATETGRAEPAAEEHRIEPA